MRILLVKPSLPPDAIGVAEVSFMPILSLESLAGCVPDHEVEIVDLRVEPDIDRYLREFEPEVVGVTGSCTEVGRALAVLRQAKQWNPHVLTLAGGHHATVMPSDFDAPEVDAIVLGEAEETFPELIAAKSVGKSLRSVPGLALPGTRGLERTTRRRQLTDLDDTPFPNRDLTRKYSDKFFLLWWRDIALMETSRGCPHKCDFCSIWKFHDGSYRFKSAERVLAEIESIEASHVYMADDNFLGGGLQRIHDICDGLLERGIRKRFLIQARADTIAAEPELMRKLADVGLEVVYFGAETFRQSFLDRANKHIMLESNEKAIAVLRDLGIHAWIGFIVDPDYTREDFRDLREYGDKLGWTMTQYTALTPLPGTDLFLERRQDLQTLDFRRYDFLHTVLPTRLPIDEFYDEFAGLYRYRYFALHNFWRLLTSHRMHGFSLGSVIRAFLMLTRMSRGSCYQLTAEESRPLAKAAEA